MTPAGRSVSGQGDVNRAEGDDRSELGDTQICAQRQPVNRKVTLGVTAAWIMELNRIRQSEIDHEHEPQRQRGATDRTRTIHYPGEFGDPLGPDERGTMNTNSRLLLSVEEAADVLRLGRTRTYDLVMSRKIQSVKVGRRRLVVRSSLDDFVRTLLLEQERG